MDSEKVQAIILEALSSCTSMSAENLAKVLVKNTGTCGSVLSDAFSELREAGVVDSVWEIDCRGKRELRFFLAW